MTPDQASTRETDAPEVRTDLKPHNQANGGNPEDLDRALATAATSRSDSSVHEDYRVHIPVFDGPLDLLLHLLRKEQLNIYDIPIAQICRSYLEQIELMQQPDVNLAGEFMVMAATLTQIKSQMLLPREENAAEEEDPRLPLVAQLLEYEQFKRAADELDGRPWLHRDIFIRPPEIARDAMPVESLLIAPIEPVDTFQLLLCLKAAINRTNRPPLVVSTDPTSIKDKVVLMTNLMEATELIDFALLLPPIVERRARDIIVSFLAVLELAKLKFIEILQHEAFGQIQVRAVRPLRELNSGMLDSY